MREGKWFCPTAQATRSSRVQRLVRMWKYKRVDTSLIWARIWDAFCVYTSAFLCSMQGKNHSVRSHYQINIGIVSFIWACIVLLQHTCSAALPSLRWRWVLRPGSTAHEIQIQRWRRCIACQDYWSETQDDSKYGSGWWAPWWSFDRRFVCFP